MRVFICLLSALGAFVIVEPTLLAQTGSITDADTPIRARVVHSETEAVAVELEPATATGCNCGVIHECNQCDTLHRLLGYPGRQVGFEIRGWLSQGFTINPQSPQSNTNTPVTFNDRANEYQMNQLYAVLEKKVATDGGWDLGGRVDVLYGTDYFFTMAAGLETNTDGTQRWNRDGGPRTTGAGPAPLYGIAMPQAYAEVFAPFGNGVNVKLGHFYTILGYESVMAPENFFYSHAYTMQYGEPFTHTGMLATTQISDSLEVSAGFTRGWDNWEDVDGQLAFLGGINWHNDCTSLAFTIHTGAESTAIGDANTTVMSAVLQRQLASDWTWVLQSDFGVAQDGELVLAPTNYGSAKWYGVNTYLFRELSDELSVGGRFEWFRDQDSARVFAVPIQSLIQGRDYFEVTIGGNWRPYSCVMVRPEIRWDWSNISAIAPLSAPGMFDDFSRDFQLTAALDVIWQF